LLTNGLVLWIPWLLRNAINALERGVELRVVSSFAGWIIAVALLQAVVRTFSRMVILGTSRRIIFGIRNRFFGHLQRLAAGYYDSHRTGDIMSRGVNDMQLMQAFFGPGVMNLLNTVIIYTATIVILLNIDVRLTLISLMLYPLLFVTVNRLSRRVFKRSLAVQEQLAAISNRAQENISGIQQVKTYVQEEREIAGWSTLCEEFRRRNLSMTVVRGGMTALIGIVTGIATLIVIFVGGRYVIEGRISFGEFVAFNAYLGLLTWPTIALGWIINLFQRGTGAMQRLGQVLGARPEIPAAVDEQAAAGQMVDGDIEIEGLTFAYEGAGDRALPALHDVSLRIAKGSRVAIVGPVGSGKSTLAGLLARLYPAPPGTIRIGGEDIAAIPTSRLRRSVAFVPQEAFLFSRSLKENILFGLPEATAAQLARAVGAAHLSDDIATFPRGLETVVGERGHTLSGGQRQRTTLARALIGERRILILDDALSSVDADTERAILEELDKFMEGRTSILISHRVSTLAGMDRILVLDRGSVVEEGTHSELIDRQGLYARLFRRDRLESSLEER